MPHIVNRIAKHKKAVGAVLSAGLARGMRCNPAASLRVHLLYCLPVLFSGLASLVLSKAEIKIIAIHYQSTIQNLLRLHTRTPRAIVFFLAGTLPGEAILHQHQLALFSLICHLPTDPLNAHARYVFTYCMPSSKSWFLEIKNICKQYGLPHPITLLDNPLSKAQFKKLVKTKIYEHWHGVLSCEVFSLSSMKFFDPSFHSISLRIHCGQQLRAIATNVLKVQCLLEW